MMTKEDNDAVNEPLNIPDSNVPLPDVSLTVPHILVQKQLLTYLCFVFKKKTSKKNTNKKTTEKKTTENKKTEKKTTKTRTLVEVQPGNWRFQDHIDEDNKKECLPNANQHLSD